jgi:hypothetical protein
MERMHTEQLATPPRRAIRRTPKPLEAAENGLVRLQRAAGNAAVTSLVQRQPDTTGWSKTTGWNAKAQEVGSTKIERIPIEGLTTGNQEDFGGGTEHDKTTESAKGRAIVLLPLAHDPTKPAEVMLHYHGFGHRSFDPYAGWRQDTRSKTVRDVEQDRIEEQMKAAIDSHADAAQTIVVLVQGVGASKFGGAASNDYAKEALRIAAGKGFPQLPEVPKDFKLVLSAHSGGGQNAVLAAVQVDQKKHTITEPDNLAEIVLMDAIHGWHADLVGQWAEAHMRRVREAAPADRAKELAKCPTLRLYHSDDAPYPDRYGVVERYLKDSHARNRTT